MVSIRSSRIARHIVAPNRRQLLRLLVQRKRKPTAHIETPKQHVCDRQTSEIAQKRREQNGVRVLRVVQLLAAHSHQHNVPIHAPNRVEQTALTARKLRRADRNALARGLHQIIAFARRVFVRTESQNDEIRGFREGNRVIEELRAVAENVAATRSEDNLRARRTHWNALEQRVDVIGQSLVIACEHHRAVRIRADNRDSLVIVA